MKKISKTEVQEKIKDFFSHIKHKSPEEVKKIKKLAMSHNIKLGDKRKLFCKKCLSPFGKDSSIRIKDGFLAIECGKCNSKNRWKLNKEINLDINHEDVGCC
jgi:RNase P subunit RPR2